MSAALRSGVDLVDVRRIADLVDAGGATFITQVWTAAEAKYCAGSAERLATRWGAKEAVMKALQAGFPAIDYRDIEIVASQGVAPRLLLRGTALRCAQAQGLTRWSLSLTHASGFAVAFAVAQGDVDV